MSFCLIRLHSIQKSMEEKMCQQTKTFPKPQIHHFNEQSTPRLMNCHRCNMCSSYSSSPSLSSTSGCSSTSSSSLSIVSSPVISSSDSHSSRRSRDKKSSSSCFIQQHLQSMFSLLRREETLKMVRTHFSVEYCICCVL